MKFKQSGLFIPYEDSNNYKAFARLINKYFYNSGEVIYTMQERKQEAGKKFDLNKPRVDLFPTESLEEISKVLAFGAEKYGEYNWCGGMSWSRLIGATLRHLFAFMRGEDIDKESNLNHLAHAGSCIIFLLWYYTNRKQYDDRYKGE